MKDATITAKPHDPPALWLSSTLVTYADDTLSWVTHAATNLLEGVDYASIVTLRPGQILGTVTSTDPLALKADLLQAELGEGPMVAVARGDVIAQCADLVTDSSWPAYGAQATQLGLRSQTALQLRRPSGIIGSLNLYSTRIGRLDTYVVEKAKLLGYQAATAVEMTRMTNDLARSVSGGSSIGHAVGIMMALHGCTSQDAFARLVTMSQMRNVKLREIAREVVDNASADAATAVRSGVAS
ncbi:MAG: GAF and ANTAR domain-containing protein [Nocardioidaceae bacterium]|nr:GAF and ANTAR domain-containing protein [Nocardioidaceae bacterium]